MTKLIANSHPLPTYVSSEQIAAIAGEMKMKEESNKLPQTRTIKAVYINEEKKTVTVKFKDGMVKTAKCSPEDAFDAQIGFALAYARGVFGSREAFESVLKNKTKSVIKAKPVKKIGRPRKKKESK